MGSSYTEDPEENGQSVKGSDQDIHVNLGVLHFPKQDRCTLLWSAPAMTYGSLVWHTLKDVKKSSSTDKLAVLQNKCLRTIAGAFKAIPISVLEAETFIAPIDIHLDQLQAKARYRLRVNGQSKFIARTCTSIANKLRGKAGRKRAQKNQPQGY